MWSWVWVGSGAALGGLLRWGVAQWLPKGMYGLNAATLLVNVAGGFAIGVLAYAFMLKTQWPLAWRLFLITGFCGGFTTFSAFSLELFGLLQTQKYLLALFGVLAHVCLSVLATALGWLLMQQWWRM